MGIFDETKPEILEAIDQGGLGAVSALQQALLDANSEESPENAISEAITKEINSILQQSVQPTNQNSLLEWLKKVDEGLKSFTAFLDDVFMTIGDCPAEFINWACEIVSGYISYLLELAKVKILNALQPQRQRAKDIIDQYGPIVEAMEAIEEPTIENIVGVVAGILRVLKLFYNFFIKPYKDAVQFISELTSRVISITSNINRIAGYTPPRMKDINLDHFQIKFQKLSVSEVLNGKILPSPPPPPFKLPPNPIKDSQSYKSFKAWQAHQKALRKLRKI